MNLVNDEPFPTDFEWLSERREAANFPEKSRKKDVLCHCDCEEGNCLES